MKSKLKILTECSVMLALSAALSVIPLYQLPWGGKITPLSMLPVLLVIIKYGPKIGFGTSIVYSIIQIGIDLSGLMSWGLTPIMWVGCLVFDYLLAYTLLGLASLTGKRSIKSIHIGITIALTGRFISHVLSGIIVFDAFCPEGWNLLLYSIVYNGAYMLPELILTLIATSIVTKLTSFRKMIDMKI